MFQLACDPSGVVVETTLKELVPAVIKWGNKLDHALRVLLSHVLSSAMVLIFLWTDTSPFSDNQDYVSDRNFLPQSTALSASFWG